jgi:hypothetical protein
VCAACTPGEIDPLDSCGPNGECAPGFLCDPTTQRCLRQTAFGSDAPLAADAPRVDAPRVDAPRVDAPRVDPRPFPQDAPPPLLALAPPTLDFGPVTLGATSPPLTFTVTNAGGSPSGTLTATLSDPSFVVGGGTCVGTAVKGGSSCTVLVVFGPLGGAGAKAATLTVADGTTTLTAMVTGTALTAGKLTLLPTAHNFGRTALDSPTDSTFTVKNTGDTMTGPLDVVVGDPEDFTITATDCAATLAAGASCSISVEFAPKLVGLKQGASLTVSADPGGSAAATLVGTGVAELTVVRNGTGTGQVVSSPAGIDCGATCAASFSVPTVTLTATADPLSRFSAWSGGGCSGTAPCDVTLDAARTVTATFDRIPAALVLAPTSHDFGSVTVGASSPPVVFTVTNNGGLPSGTLSAQSSDPTFQLGMDGCSGTSVAAGGGTCTVTVVFAPTGTAGPRSGTLTIGGLSADLTGTALSPASLSVAPSTIGFGTQTITTTSVASMLTVTNDGQTASGVLSIGTSGNDASSFGVTTDCPASQGLAPGASCHVSVTFAPASVDAKSASVTVSASPGGTTAATVTGTGTATLVVAKGGTGGGTVTSTAGIDCGTTCRKVLSTTPVMLTATPDDLSTFTRWSGGGCSGSATTCSAALASATTTVTATFTLKPAALAVTPTGNAFGSVVVGGSASSTFMVTNNGGATSGTISASVDDTADYGVPGGTCLGAPLAGGATCTLTVQFHPTTSGSKPATLTVSAAPGGSPTATLSGTGLTPATLSVTAPALPYGYATTTVGLSNSQTFTIKNVGETTSGTPMTPTLSDTTNFGITTNGCTSALIPNATCAIAVAFHPTAAGSKSATLALGATPGGTASAGMSGTGKAQLTVTNGVGGTVSSSPAGISCASGATCSAIFMQAPVTLTATPIDGSHVFASWGGACSGAGACSVPLSASPTSVTASWLAAPTVTITPTIDARGATASFAFTVSDGTPMCALDSGTASACSSPVGYSDLAPGSHTFAVSASNAAGTGSASSPFTIDAWVDGVNGSDTNLGNINHPFRRITNGISAHPTNVWVRPATYDQETFPLLAINVNLIGDVSNRGNPTAGPVTAIFGSGFFSIFGGTGATITVLLASATMEGFLIEAPTGSDAAVVATGSAPVVYRNTFATCEIDTQWCSDGLQVSSASDATIEDNVLVGHRTFGGPGHGITFASCTGCMAQANVVAGWPVANVLISGSMPDLGGGGLSSGNNTFQCGTAADVSSAVGSQTLHARNNLWDHNPPTSSTTCASGIDFCTSTNDALDYSPIKGTAGACP